MAEVGNRLKEELMFRDFDGKVLLLIGLFCIATISIGNVYSVEEVWSIHTVEADGSVFYETTIALDANEDPHVGYCLGYIDEHLKYARWNGSGWDIQIVDSDRRVGSSPSLAIDSIGNPYISYDALGASGLRYARWTGTKWDIQTVDTDGWNGDYSSMALDSNDNPHISYKGPGSSLRHARWTGTKWDIQTIEDGWGYWTSLALDSNDNPHISYSNGMDADEFWYAKWNGTGWNKQLVDAGFGAGGEHTSLALDSNDNPHISYYAKGVKYARWTGSEWDIQSIDSGGGYGISLDLDSDNNPHISYDKYINREAELRYARWTGSDWDIQTVDSDGSVGAYSSLTLDSNNNPHISYTDETNGGLKYATYSLPVHNLNTSLNYTTIQEAINALETLDGHTIKVDRGTYTENVDVNKSVNLFGAGADVTIVNAADSGDHVFEISSDNVNISGFTLTGAMTQFFSGIYLHGANYINISNNNLSNNCDGIFLSGSSHNFLIENIISSNWNEGIQLSGSTDNEIINNKVTRCSPGIALFDSSNNNIYNNSVNLNEFWGIYLSKSNNNTVFVNTLSSNSRNGLLTIGSDKNYIIGNTISNNKYEGLSFEGGVNHSISYNIIENNSRGISCFFCSNNIVYNNFFNNTPGGIYFYPSKIYPNNWNTTKTPGTNIMGGPHLGGNYWASPEGTGFSETCADADGDGICDTPYNLSSGNVDYLPLSTNISGGGGGGGGGGIYTTILSISSTNLNSTDSTLINISVNNVTNLNTVNFNFTFDPSIIKVNEILVGDFFPNANILTNVNNPSGWATGFIELPTDTGVNGSGIVATINITGKSGGISNLTLLPLGDVYLVDKYGEEIVPEVINGEVNVTIPKYYGLVAEYHFEGNTNDSSGNGNNGTNYGATYTNGISGQGLLFDGNDDYVGIGKVLLGTTGDFSVSAWIKPNDVNTGQYQAIVSEAGFSQEGEFQFRITDGDKIQFIRVTGDHSYTVDIAKSVNSIETGVWTHATAVYSAGKNDLLIYLNGVKADIIKTSDSYSVDEDSETKIGNGDDRPFNGLIDEVKIYNIAINEGEIKAEYEKNAPKYYGLVAEYHFEGNANDSSGNGNDGTLMNGAGFVTGKNGSALNLDGYDDYVDMGDVGAVEGIQQATFMAWVNPSELDTYNEIISKYNSKVQYGGFEFWITEENKLGFFLADSSHNTLNGQTIDEIDAGRWQHFIAIFDGTQLEYQNKIKLYINGLEQNLSFSSTHPFTSIPNTPHSLRVGVNTDVAGSHYFNGSIDEVKIYNIALNESEILSEYRSLVSGNSVCPSGCDFTSIQKAVDNASIGDTVNVLPGTYNENVIINKSINLIGSGMGNTRIIAANESKHVINFSANSVNISGFSLTGASGDWCAGLFLKNSGLSNIKNINASYNDFGILLNNSHNNIIQRNNVSGNRYGICLNNGSQLNSVSENTVKYTNLSGIYVRYSNNNELVNNKAWNTISLSGIFLKNSSGNTLLNNDASYNNNSGIFLYNSSNNSLTGNIANQNVNYHGIVLVESSDYNTLFENTAKKNRRNGIGLWDSQFNVLEKNIANENIDYYGIFLQDSANNTLNGNYANENNLFGFVIYNSNHNTLIKNIGNSNKGYDGFFLVNSENNLLLENQAVGNNYNGIELHKSNNNAIINNTANSTKLYGGILAFQSDLNTISGNSLNSNTYGLILDNSNYSSISENIIIENRDYGIILQNSKANKIIDNKFNNPENFGFFRTIYSNTWNTQKKEGTNIIEGPNLGGNFWGRPDGTGFSQTCTDTNADGICDPPYSLESGNVDNLPLSLNFAPPLHVCPSGCKYSSIQKAVNAAVDGQTIYVHEGTYSENVIIDKSVNLIGDGPGNTIVNASGTSEIFQINVERVNISGFTINDNGILITSNYSSVFNNIITNSRYGIDIYSGNENKITNNTIIQNNIGIFLSYSRNNNISYNLLNNNEFSGLRIYWASKENFIMGNSINNNGPDGINIHLSDGNIIDNNNIFSNIDGIILYISNDTTIKNNIVSDSQNSVKIYNSNNIEIFNNYFSNSINPLNHFVAKNSFNTAKTPATNIIGGPYIAGNYWADENGTGFSETCSDSDSDGICDDAFNINGTYVDNLPLKILMGKDAKPDNSRAYIRLTYNSSIENQTKINDTLVLRRNSDIINFNISTINFTGMVGKIIPLRQNSSSEDAIWYDPIDDNYLGDTSDYVLYNRLYIIDNNTVQPALDIINDPRIFMGLDSTNGSWTSGEEGTYNGGLGWLGSVVKIKGDKYLVTREVSNYQVEVASAKVVTFADKGAGGNLTDYASTIFGGKIAWQAVDPPSGSGNSSFGVLFILDADGNTEKTIAVDLGSGSTSDAFTNTSAKTGILKSSVLSGTSFAGYKIFLINQTNKNIKVIVGKEGEFTLSNDMDNAMGYYNLYLNMGALNSAFPQLSDTSALLMGPVLNLEDNSEIDIPDTDYKLLLKKSGDTTPKTYIYLYNGITLYDFMNPFGDFLKRSVTLDISGNDAVLSWDNNQKSTIIKSSGLMKPSDPEYSDFLTREMWLHVQTPPAPRSSGGGGGGGGGGGNDATAFISKIEEGKTEIAKFSEKKSPSISEIHITAKNDIYSVGLTLKYPSKQPFGTKEIEDEVYKFIEIKKSNTLKDEDIEKAIINFKIEKKWLEDNDIDKDSVLLSRFHNGEWVKLETSLVDEDEDFAYYEANTPGFSYFAICGVSGSGFEKPSSERSMSFEGFDMSMFPTMREEPTEDALSEEPENEEILEIVEPEEEIIEPPQREDRGAAMPLAIILLVGGLAAGAGFYYRKFSGKK